MSGVIYKRAGQMPKTFTVAIRFGKKDEALAQRLWDAPRAAPAVVREVLRRALASGVLADVIREMQEGQR